MKYKTARRLLNRNRWRIARSRAQEEDKIRPPSLRKRITQAMKILNNENTS